MAVRIRRDGRILCAAMHPANKGDTYLDDELHYTLSVELDVLVTEPMHSEVGRGGHVQHGEWWWRHRVPADVVLENWRPRRPWWSRVAWSMFAAVRRPEPPQCESCNDTGMRSGHEGRYVVSLPGPCTHCPRGALMQQMWNERLGDFMHDAEKIPGPI